MNNKEYYDNILKNNKELCDNLFTIGIKAYNKHIISINSKRNSLREIVLNKLMFNYILNIVTDYGLSHKFNEKYYEYMIEEEIKRNTEIFSEINEILNSENNISTNQIDISNNELDIINEIKCENKNISNKNEINEITNEIDNIHNEINKITNQINEIIFY
jgi:hypothetical protein